MNMYPKSGVRDLVNIVRDLAIGRLKRVDSSETLARWLHSLTVKYQSKTVVLDLVIRKILLVTDPVLSAHILASKPASTDYVEGTLKRDAMAFLAPNALTISHDEQWQALRGYNEKVLCTHAHHIYQQPFLDHVHRAFAEPIHSMADIRQRMGQVMLAIVFGEGNAPDHLIDGIQELFAEFNVRTALFGSKKGAERDQFYRVLHSLWERPIDEETPALVTLAHGEKESLGPKYGRQEVLLEQFPHWMFTFTNSGSDLLTRSLAMITARPDCLHRVQEEIDAAGSLDQSASIHKLRYLEACLLETGRLYPPVSQTTHRASNNDEFEDNLIAAGTETLQLFSLNTRDQSQDPDANHFRPERWLDDDDPVHDHYPNLFLSGARSCPGKELILFVDTAALAIIIQNQMRTARDNQLSADPLPFTFPKETLTF